MRNIFLATSILFKVISYRYVKYKPINLPIYQKMLFYLRHNDKHLETGRKIGEPGRKKEADLISFNNLIREEEMGNPGEKK